MFRLESKSVVVSQNVSPWKKKYIYSPAMWPLTCAAAGALCAAVVGVAIKKRGKKRPRDEDVQDAEEQEYQLWAACEVCGRWRMLPKPLEDENAPWDCSVGGWSSGPTCIEKPGAPCRKCTPYEIKASKKAYAARRNARPEIKASKKAYNARPEIKARRKAYDARRSPQPEIKARQKACDAARRARNACCCGLTTCVHGPGQARFDIYIYYIL